MGIAARALRALERDEPWTYDSLTLRKIADGYGASLDMLFGRHPGSLEAFANAPMEARQAQLAGLIALLSSALEDEQSQSHLLYAAAAIAKGWPSEALQEQFLSPDLNQRAGALRKLLRSLSSTIHDAELARALAVIGLRVVKLESEIVSSSIPEPSRGGGEKTAADDSRQLAADRADSAHRQATGLDLHLRDIEQAFGGAKLSGSGSRVSKSKRSPRLGKSARKATNSQGRTAR